MNPKIKRLYLKSRLSGLGSWRREVLINKSIASQISESKGCDLKFIRITYKENAYEDYRSK